MPVRVCKEWSALALRSVVASVIEAIDSLATNRFSESLREPDWSTAPLSSGPSISLPEIQTLIQSLDSVSLMLKRCKHRIFQVASAIPL